MISILVTHNQYQQPGGEDSVVRAEKALLSAAGHRVTEYLRDNGEIARYGIPGKMTLIPRTLWAWDSYAELRLCLERNKPDLVHFHNTFPLISPAAYYACREAGIPVIQTLHNYRLLCPTATFFRNGHVCEACVQHSLWRSVRYGCYRESRTASSAVALMLAFHRRQKTWARMVDGYIALTNFSRNKFIEAGWPANKIAVKPNFVHPDPGRRTGRGDYTLFVGRISAEKGLETLLSAWQYLGLQIPLRIVGDGALSAKLEITRAQRGLSAIRLEGQLAHAEVVQAIRGAAFLICPSESYESFPLTIIEAFACGVPVVASGLGAMAEIVGDRRTGLHFTPGDPSDLAAKVEWAWTHPRESEAMGRNAREEYEKKYTAERNYQMLRSIYLRAFAARRSD